MKTKIKNLLARLFVPAAVNEVKPQANVVSSSSRENELRQAAREREEQRQALLKELYFAVLCHDYREVERLVPAYQGKFGRLTGEERVYLPDSSCDGYGKLDDEIPTFSSYPLLLAADAAMKEFFFASAEGKNPFQLDYAKEPNGGLQEFLAGETRFAALDKKAPDVAQQLKEQLDKSYMDRFAMYKQMAELPLPGSNS